MKPYPLMMNIDGATVLVVGGGRVALRKIETVLECGAKVVVAAPDVVNEIEELAQDGRIELIREAFDESLVERFSNASLVFGTTDDRKVNVRIHAAATRFKIPCNIADVPDLCTFIVPAVMSRGDR